VGEDRNPRDDSGCDEAGVLGAFAVRFVAVSHGLPSHCRRKLELPGKYVPKPELGNERKVLTSVSHELGPAGFYLFVDYHTVEEVFVEGLGTAVKGYGDDFEHGRFLCRRRDGAVSGSWSFQCNGFPSLPVRCTQAGWSLGTRGNRTKMVMGIPDSAAQRTGNASGAG